MAVISNLCDFYFSLQLKPFQMVGLNWLKVMHTQEINGILADEMVKYTCLYPILSSSVYRPPFASYFTLELKPFMLLNDKFFFLLTN